MTVMHIECGHGVVRPCLGRRAHLILSGHGVGTKVFRLAEYLVKVWLSQSSTPLSRTKSEVRKTPS